PASSGRSASHLMATALTSRYFLRTPYRYSCAFSTKPAGKNLHASRLRSTPTTFGTGIFQVRNHALSMATEHSDQTIPNTATVLMRISCSSTPMQSALLALSYGPPFTSAFNPLPRDNQLRSTNVT